MAIALQPVTREHFAAVLDTKVAPGQEEFVAPNLYSLAEAYVEPTWTPLAIVAEEEIVGFVVYGRHEASGRWCISRYMIDAGHQRAMGYGLMLVLAVWSSSRLITSSS